MIEILLKLGLSDKEAHVYLAVLELGEDTVQNIAAKSGVKRVTVYVILERLMKLGLVSTVERGKKTVFIAEDPAELANLLEAQKREIDSKRQYLDEAMTQLKAIHNVSADKPIVRYFEGPDGLEALDRYGHDQFPQDSEMLGIIPIDLVEEQFPQRRKAAVSDRVARRIKSRMIYTHKAGELDQYINKKELRDGVFISRDKFPIDATIQIYPTWGIKFYNFNPDRHFGVLLQSPDLARNLQHMFELAWKKAKENQG
jgi:sugar-specific transcriptional regulator TrmB